MKSSAANSPLHERSDVINKTDVADSFSKAANSYDGAAAMQRDIASQLLKHLQTADKREQVQRLLDLGCGTGFMAETFLRQNLAKEIIGADLAEGMVSFAQEHHGNQALWMCADAEKLPFAAGSLDWVFSSFALQWCPDLQKAFSQVHRCLTFQGKFAGSMPGAGTLMELQQSWKAVDEYTHVNEFITAEAIEEKLKNVGFKSVTIHKETIVLEYDSVKALMAELKAIGAHNMNGDRSKGLTGKSKLKSLFNSYESFRLPSGKLPATYEVIYWVAER